MKLYSTLPFLKYISNANKCVSMSSPIRFLSGIRNLMASSNGFSTCFNKNSEI